MGRSMNKENTPIYRLFKTRHNCCQMLQNRGYIMKQYDIKMNYEKFLCLYNIPSNNYEFDLIARSSTNMDDKIIVYFFTPIGKINLNNQTLIQFYERMKENGIPR